MCKDLDFPYGDLRNITTELEWKNGLEASVLCEGCGPIQVDCDGNCITKNCFKKHRSK